MPKLFLYCKVTTFFGFESTLPLLIVALAHDSSQAASIAITVVAAVVIRRHAQVLLDILPKERQVVKAQVVGNLLYAQGAVEQLLLDVTHRVKGD